MEYRIGSFNMKRFGRNAVKDFSKIAEIITEEDFDIVALQEIFSIDNFSKSATQLQFLVKHELYNWECCCASPSESGDIAKIGDMIKNDTRGEGYAYLWNKSRFKKVEFKKLNQSRIFEPHILNSYNYNDVKQNCSTFARTPYYIRLQPIYGGYFEIRLINIHVYFGDKTLSSIAKRKAEYDLLTQEIYPSISTHRYGQARAAYTIALGDYNLNIFNPAVKTREKNCYLTQSYSYNDGKTTVNILTMQDQLTTVGTPDNNENAGTDDVKITLANNFDHFTYSPELSQFKKVAFETIDAINKYCNNDRDYYVKNISDHLPIKMIIEI